MKRELTHSEQMDRLSLGWFTKRDPSLIDESHSYLDGILGDFLAHVNSHTGMDFNAPASSNGPTGGDPQAILNYCAFCKIIKREDSYERKRTA